MSGKASVWGSSAAARRLGIAQPIIQGPLGGGLSTAKLTATVSNLGGLGSFGAHHLPPGEIAKVADEIRALTARPFALNLWVSDHDAGGAALDETSFERYWRLFEPYFAELGVEKPERPQRFHHAFPDQMEALLEARPPIFSFVFGIPTPKILEACRARGIVTIGTATSIAEAEAIEAAGIDFVVATGFEAGGHRPSFLARAEESLMGTFALTQVVSRRVRIPVAAAGGIIDSAGIRAALALGAQAVQIGTAFLACTESNASDAHRAALFSDQARHTVLTRAFSGRLARGIRNRWSAEMAERGAELAPFPVQNWFLSKLRPAVVAAGRTDLVSLWSGQIAPNLRHRNAAALMAELTGEAVEENARAIG